MADFSNSILSEPGALPLDAGQPRPDVSSAVALEGLGKIGASLFAAHSQGQKGKAEKASNAIVGKFAAEQLNTINSGMDPAKRKLLLRTNLAKYVAAYGELAPDLTTQHNKILSDKVLTEGLFPKEDPVVEQERKNWARATEKHYVWSGQTPEQRKAGYARMVERERIEANMGELSQKIALDRANIGKQSDLLSLYNARDQRQSRQLLSQRADNETYRLFNMFQGLLANPGLTDAEKLESGRQQMDAVRATAASVGAFAGSEFVSQRIKPMEDMYKSFEDVVNKKASIDIFKTKAEYAMTEQTAMLMSNQKLAGWAALTKMFPYAQDIQRIVTQDEVLRLMDRSVQGKSVNVTDLEPDQLKLWKSSQSKAYRDALAGNLDAEGIKALNDSTSATLKGIDAYQLAVDDPKKYGYVVDMLADPYFGQYVEKNGGMFKGDLSKVQSVIQREWADEVIPSLRKEMSGFIKEFDPSGANVSASGFSSFKDVPTSSGVTVEFVGNGVQFVAKAPRGTADQFVREARSLNKKLAPKLNRLIRATAHMEATTDYRAVWDRYKTQFTQGTVDTTSQRSQPTDDPSWYRPDGSKKGMGFLGPLKTKDGYTATEISIGVPINGKEMDIPTLVPTLTQEEVQWMLDGNKPTPQIVGKAAKYAKQRIAEGKDVFANTKDGDY